MTNEIFPFYEPIILTMPLEKHAEIAIDGAVWLTGELLAFQGLQHELFDPNPSYLYRPRHLEDAIIALESAAEDLRHRVFIEGFRRQPDNGAKGTFERLLTTHRGMLDEAFRSQWERRLNKMIYIIGPLGAAKTVANELLHRLPSPR